MKTMRLARPIAVLAAAASIAAITACGDSKSDSGSSSGGGSDKQVTIKLSTPVSPTDPMTQGADRFKQTVEKESGGSIKVQVYPANQLGDTTSIIPKVQQNSVQMIEDTAAELSSLVPDIGVLDAPYLWKSFDDERKALDGDLYKKFSDELADKQLKLLATNWYYGLRDLTANKEVNTPADGDGLTIRVPGGDISELVGHALGGKPTDLPFDQVYLALKTGSLDAQENPLSTILSTKIYEVQKDLVLTKHQLQTFPITMSLTFWDSLSKNQQDIVQKAATSAGDYESKLAMDAESKDLDELKKKGMNVVEPDIAAFSENADKLVSESGLPWVDLYKQLKADQGAS